MNIDIQPIQIEPRSFGSRCCEGLESQLSDEDAQALSDQLQLIGHPIRLQILDILARQAGQVCVCDLEAALPIKQATVSHHLRLLRAGGLIDAERHGQWAFYFVKRPALAALRERANQLLGAWGSNEASKQ
jgi:ArsR family transcriptional regulator, arsenate/arsenite/antimonite-responsive transcriptional repressor